MNQLNQVVESVKPVSHDIMEATQSRLDDLTKPKGSLGCLEELAKQLAGIRGTVRSQITQKAIVVMAADHGVTEESISAYPQAVTAQMISNFINGGAAINVLARHVNAEIVLVDMGVACELVPDPRLIDAKIGFGTQNIAKGPAMTREQALLSLEHGIRIVQEYAERAGLDVLGTGDMGIGNTTASSAIIATFTGLPIEAVTGRGTGIDDQTFERKISTIARALTINEPDANNPIDVLTKVGGFEIGGLAGCILAAASLNVPVIIDGFISSAAALLAYRIQPLVKDYMLFGHQSVEVGQTAVLEELGKRPILDLNMRLGEGTGAALAMSILEASVKIINEMSTFSQASVSQSIEESRITN